MKFTLHTWFRPRPRHRRAWIVLPGLAIIALASAIPAAAPTVNPLQTEAASVLGLSASGLEATAVASAQAAPGPTTVVFISASIPQDRLAKLFVSAQGRESDTLFLLRGWTPPSFQSVVAHVASAVKAANENRDGAGSPINPNIAIDPTPFREYQIASVPTTLTKCNDGAWRRSIGEMALEGAQRAACDQPGAVIGPVFPVAEPDILEVIEARANSMDWDAVIAGVAERAETGQTLKITPLPGATDSRVTTWDPTVTVSQDITLPNQQVLARRGQRINPLSVLTLRPMVVWNPSIAAERPIVERWLKKHPAAVVLVTSVFLPDGKSAAEAMRIQVFPLFGDFVARTGVTVTPTLIEQKDSLLQLTVESPLNAAATSTQLVPSPAKLPQVRQTRSTSRND